MTVFSLSWTWNFKVCFCYLTGVSKFKRTGLDKLVNSLILWVSHCTCTYNLSSSTFRKVKFYKGVNAELCWPQTIPFWVWSVLKLGALSLKPWVIILYHQNLCAPGMFILCPEVPYRIVIAFYDFIPFCSNFEKLGILMSCVYFHYFILL